MNKDRIVTCRGIDEGMLDTKDGGTCLRGVRGGDREPAGGTIEDKGVKLAAVTRDELRVGEVVWVCRAAKRWNRFTGEVGFPTGMIIGGGGEVTSGGCVALSMGPGEQSAVARESLEGRVLKFGVSRRLFRKLFVSSSTPFITGSQFYENESYSINLLQSQVNTYSKFKYCFIWFKSNIILFRRTCYVENENWVSIEFSFW